MSTYLTIFAFLSLGIWGGSLLANPSPISSLKTTPEQLRAINQNTTYSNIHPEFKTPVALRKRVDFWIKVFTKYDSNQLIVNDKKYPYIIYTVLDFSDSKDGSGNNLTRSNKWKIYHSHKKKYQKILRKLAKPKLNVDSLSQEESRVYNLFSSVKEKDKFAKAAKFRRFRSQLGQRDEFLKALITSGAYRPRMEQIFAEHELPKEISLLPFVESFFKIKARSRKGATGLWQFIRSTGRRFLRINTAIDERKDPFLATEAAAKYMLENYQRLGSWPLAITAYNHGPGGIKRAIRKTKSRDLAYIIEHYKSRRFGFDSQNFFAELLAVIEIVNNYQEHFGPVTLDPPLEFEVVEIDTPIMLTTLAKGTPLTKQEIVQLNPALQKAVLSSWRPIPKKYNLKIPPGTKEEFRVAYAKIPSAKISITSREKTQKGWHKVEWGETLSEIARHYGTSINTLVDLNNLYNRHSLRAGQLLRVSNDIQLEISPVVSDAPMVTQPLIAEIPVSSKSSDYSIVMVDNDHSVAWIEVKTNETLGHFADWCQIKTQSLRDLNDLGWREPLKVGQRILVDVSKVAPEELAKKREQFHNRLHQEFLTKYKIERVKAHVLKRHQNAWDVCRYIYNVPLWLVEKYNTGRNLAQLRPGDTLSIPILSHVPVEL